MVEFDVPEVDYSRYTNRQLVAVPLVVLLLALTVLGWWYLATGAPVSPGIDFTGGSELRIQTTASTGDIGTAFATEPTSIQPVRTESNTYIVTFQAKDTGDLAQQAESLPTVPGEETVVQSQSRTSVAFGAATQQLTVLGVAVAFVGMSLLAFALFRTFVPSIAIVLSAFSDIVVPLAVMNLLGIKLSLGTVAGLLMLIGYSVDSDILLTNHVLRRSGGFYESAYRAMRTGVTMTVTSLAAMATMAVVAYLFGIGLLSSIGLVLVIGLTTDLMNTYMFNFGLLRWYKFEGVAR